MAMPQGFRCVIEGGVEEGVPILIYLLYITAHSSSEWMFEDVCMNIYMYTCMCR
jgi:hypothetical protein